jgi:hypothetical protein
MDSTQLQTNMITKELEKFYYVNDIDYQRMLKNAYQAINLTEMWDYVKKDIDRFMYNNDDEINIITKKMSELGYNEHSGSSFGWTMRHMQFIAEHGLEKHRNNWMEK